jgi:hypothetical protein
MTYIYDDYLEQTHQRNRKEKTDIAYRGIIKRILFMVKKGIELLSFFRDLLFSPGYRHYTRIDHGHEYVACRGLNRW